MHAVPYRQVGFYGDQVMSPAGTCTNPATCEPASPDGASFPVVVVGPTSPATPQILPTGTVQVGPLTYAVTRYVEWADVTGAGGATTTTTLYSHAYKRTSVTVGWVDQSGSHTVREDSILYPGGIGKFQSTTTTASGTAPFAPVITAATVLGPSEVDLTWTQSGGGAVASYSLQYSTDPNFVMTFAQINSIPSTATYLPVTGISSNTFYYFRLIANGAGAASATSSTVGPELTSPASGVCNVNSLVVTGATSGGSTGTIVQPSGAMSENLYLTVNTSGYCTGHNFSVSGQDQFANPDPGSAWPVTGGASYTATVSSLSQLGWSTGTHTFTVLDGGSSTGVVKAFSVCVVGSSSC
jgi:hypothetical protein